MCYICEQMRFCRPGISELFHRGATFCPLSGSSCRLIKVPWRLLPGRNRTCHFLQMKSVLYNYYGVYWLKMRLLKARTNKRIQSQSHTYKMSITAFIIPMLWLHTSSNFWLPFSERSFSDEFNLKKRASCCPLSNIYLYYQMLFELCGHKDCYLVFRS